MEKNDKPIQPAMPTPSGISSDDMPGKGGRATLFICPKCKNQVAKTGTNCPVCGVKLWEDLR